MNTEPLDPAAIMAEHDRLARDYLAAFPNTVVQIDLGNRLALMSPEVARLAAALAEREWVIAGALELLAVDETDLHKAIEVRARLDEQTRHVLAERDAQIAVVRALHTDVPDDLRQGGWCACGWSRPCPTSAALGGAE